MATKTLGVAWKRDSRSQVPTVSAPLFVVVYLSAFCLCFHLQYGVSPSACFQGPQPRTAARVDALEDPSSPQGWLHLSGIPNLCLFPAEVWEQSLESVPDPPPHLALEPVFYLRIPGRSLGGGYPVQEA